MTNRRGRRSTKKKHDLPLTEEMLNELNKNSLSGYGHHGMGHGPGMTERHHPSAMHHGGGGGAYDNYGQDPDDFYDATSQEIYLFTTLGNMKHVLRECLFNPCKAAYINQYFNI